MIVTVTDMFDGVTPETSPVTITVIEGSATSGGGGGAVDSVNGHVGVVVLDADDLADGTTNHVFTATDDTKLAGIATAATANDTDANLKARANHTGTQAISTVTGLQTALDGKDTALAAHEADTTNVHGIADTSALETTTGSAAKVAAHAGLSDPHPGYLTPAEGNAAYDALGAASSAQSASQPLDSDLTTIAALDSATAGALTTDGSGWIRKTYAQLKTALSLVKADVGLGSVDNTADTAKPVSTAQQAALDLKANLASPTFTGNPAAPTASPGDNDTSIATTAFVTAAVAAGGGGLLACQQHNPGTQSTVSSTSTSYADVDATNAAITFTVPASGNVLIRAGAVGVPDGGTVIGLNLRLGGSDVSGSGQRVLYVATNGPQIRVNYSYKLTGLTPGASVTYKLGIARIGGSGACALFWGGGDGVWGALVMEAWSAP